MHTLLRHCGRVSGCLLLAFILMVAVAPVALAAINAQNLGAKYDATQANITFRVYSSRPIQLILLTDLEPTVNDLVASRNLYH